MSDAAKRKRIESPDGQEAIEIGERDDGLWSFSVWKLYDPFPGNPHVGGLTWVVSREGGLYASLAEVEAAIEADIRWLRS